MIITRQLKVILSILLLVSFEALALDISNGTVVGRHIFGLSHDYQGDPLMREMDPVIYNSNSAPHILVKDDMSFQVNVFNENIGAIYITSLNRKNSKPVDTSLIKASNVQGISYPAFSTKSSWGTVLFSESVNVDGAKPNEFVNEYKPYFKNNSDMVKPYNYGWVGEVILLDKHANAKVIKNYAVGRVMADQIIAMPDDKTYYLLDSSKGGRLYAFISDQPQSLAKGNLYAVDLQKGSLKYKKLGNIPALKMKFKLRKAKYSSFLESKKPESKVCSPGYKYIFTVYGDECLKVKKKNRKYVGQFEPVRASALLGVSDWAKTIKNIKYDTRKAQLELVKRDGSSMHISISKETQFNSKFIAELIQ